MIERFFVDTCYKQTITRNRQGEKVSSGETSFVCRFRYISSFVESNNLEQIDSDALLHAPEGAGLQKGDIIRYKNREGEDELYTVQRVVEARRGGSTIVQFLKCDLKRQYTNE